MPDGGSLESQILSSHQSQVYGFDESRIRSENHGSAEGQQRRQSGREKIEVPVSHAPPPNFIPACPPVSDPGIVCSPAVGNAPGQQTYEGEVQQSAPEARPSR